MKASGAWRSHLMETSHACAAAISSRALQCRQSFSSTLPCTLQFSSIPQASPSTCSSSAEGRRSPAGRRVRSGSNDAVTEHGMKLAVTEVKLHWKSLLPITRTASAYVTPYCPHHRHQPQCCLQTRLASARSRTTSSATRASSQRPDTYGEQEMLEECCARQSTIASIGVASHIPANITHLA